MRIRRQRTVALLISALLLVSSCTSVRSPQATYSVPPPLAPVELETSRTPHGTLVFIEPVHDDHGNLKVRLERADDVQKILSALQAGGATFLGLDVRKPDLEEVFLKLTDEALRKEPAAGEAE